MDKKDKALLLLTLDAFKTRGGVQSVSKTLCYTLRSIVKQYFGHSLKVLSLYDKEPDNRYIDHKSFKGFSKNKLYFLFYAIKYGCRSDKVILTHIHLLFIAKLIKLLNKRVEIILIAHGVEVWRKLHPWKVRFIQQDILILAVSNFTKFILHKQHHICKTKIIVLNNCLDPLFKVPGTFAKSSRLLTKHGLSKDQPVILSICRLTPHENDKGYQLIISIIPELLNEFPDLHYLLCGRADSDEKQYLQKLIAEKRLQKHVSMVDLIPENELTDYYLLSDVFALPSKKEGFGLVFIEAAACGCQILAGNADGSSDAVLNGKLGKLIDPEDKKEIIAALSNCLRQKRNVKNALQIQRTCLEHFGQSRYQEKVKHLLNNIRH